MKASRLPAILLLLIYSLNSFAQAGEQKITLEALFSDGEYRPSSVYGLNSMKDGRHFTISDQGRKITRFNYATGQQIDNILDISEGNYDFEFFTKYEFSANEDKLLLTTKFEKMYRHSYRANFYIFDLDKKSMYPLSKNGKQRLATFSPDGNKVAFVRENDLFYVDLLTDQEHQITTDGEYNSIINGATDWVYEEEFAFTKAFQWSPDGKNLVFYKFDEERVKQFNMTLYKNQLYPENYTFKYPKAGEENSIVALHNYNLETGEIIKIDIGPETDQYIPRIKFSNDPEMLAIVRLNRLQNHLEILMADITTGNSNVIYSEKNQRYITEIDDYYITFINDKNDFIINSEKSGFNHLYLMDANGNEQRQITKGPWVVTEFNGYDPESKLVYYTSAENSPLRRDVYAIKLNGRKKTKLSVETGTNRADFSKNFEYYINYFSNVSTPPLITLHSSDGKLLRVLEDNKRLKEKVNAVDSPAKEFFTFSTTEGVELNGWMIKPANFDETKTYPVVMYVYGGPGSQTVTDSWSFGWYEYLAQEGYIVVSVDNRGTGARGEAFKKITYGQLGYYETIDQIEAAKYLRNLNYVNPDRIGIFGWSYGGYMSALGITKGAPFFKAAIAVAPVTNWRYYDTIYTERYMGLPQKNPEGYDNNSPVNHVEKLQGNFLLIHGMGDDNVHLQNSVALAEAMVQNNKQFDMFYYSDKDHSIYGGNTRLHLYTKMSDYLFKNL